MLNSNYHKTNEIGRSNWNDCWHFYHAFNEISFCILITLFPLSRTKTLRWWNVFAWLIFWPFYSHHTSHCAFINIGKINLIITFRIYSFPSRHDIACHNNHCYYYLGYFKCRVKLVYCKNLLAYNNSFWDKKNNNSFVRYFFNRKTKIYIS